MNYKLMKLKLRWKITKLQKKIKKQEKLMVTILDELEQIEPKGKEFISNK